MKFRLFQKYNRKISIWSGSVALFISLLSLLILLAIPIPSNKDKVMIGVQIVINEFFIWLLLWATNRSRIWLQFLIQVNVYRNKRNFDHVNLSLNKSVYFWLFLFLGLIWLIETSSFILWTKSWSQAINRYWWITLIFFGINYFYLLIFWLSQVYLYNHDKQILKNLSNPSNRY